MKIKIVALLLFISFSKSFGQSSTDMGMLKAATEKMYTASYNLDLNTVMDLTYPKVFDIVDRETLLTAMKEMFQNETMTISFNYPKADFAYSDITTIDNKKFSIIRYKSSMKMTLNQDFGPEGVQAMTDGLKSSGKFKTVNYDAKTNSLLVEGDAIMIGVSDASTKNLWTFVNYDDDQLFKLIFDESLKQKLGL